MGAKRERPETALLRELAALAGGFKPGLEHSRVLRTDDGLEVEVSIRVRRRLDADRAAELRAEVLAYLRQPNGLTGIPNAIEVEHCGCTLNRKPGGFSSSGGPCDGRVVAAVVYIWERWNQQPPRNSFRFICGRHRETHRIDPTTIVGVVELPAHTLAEAHELAHAQRVKWQRESIAKEHARGEHRPMTTVDGRVYSRRIDACPECKAEREAEAAAAAAAPRGPRLVKS
jgi:hypothetical protein